MHFFIKHAINNDVHKRCLNQKKNLSKKSKLILFLASPIIAKFDITNSPSSLLKLNEHRKGCSLKLAE